MSLALFRSTLRSAVREAQAADASPDHAPPPSKAPHEAELLRQVARGELTAEEALDQLRGAR